VAKDDIRKNCTFCKKDTVMHLFLKSKHSYTPTDLGMCKMCGSAIDCVIEAKEKEYYNAHC